jgi:hypothetical protein
MKRLIAAAITAALPALSCAQDITISGMASQEAGAGVQPFSLSFTADGYSPGLCEAYQLGFPFSGIVQFNFANGFSATAPNGESVPNAACGGYLFGIPTAGAYDYQFNNPGNTPISAPPPPATGWELIVTEIDPPIANVREPGTLALMLAAVPPFFLFRRKCRRCGVPLYIAERWRGTCVACRARMLRRVLRELCERRSAMQKR